MCLGNAGMGVSAGQSASGDRRTGEECGPISGLATNPGVPMGQAAGPAHTGVPILAYTGVSI